MMGLVMGHEEESHARGQGPDWKPPIEQGDSEEGRWEGSGPG